MANKKIINNDEINSDMKNIETNNNEVLNIENENIIKEKDNQIKEKDNQIRNMQSQLDKLEGMLEVLMSNNSNNNNNNQAAIMDLTPKMDKPYTLIHLLECSPDLPTVIEVNGVNHYFVRFGQERTFRYAELQNVISKYLSWFERGIFTLGNDCVGKENEFGIEIAGLPIPIHIYNKIETLSDAEFELLVKKINDCQRVNLAKTWVQRYMANKDNYRDVNKIRILNKYTKDKVLFKNGLLANLLKDAIDEESDNFEN